MPYPSLYQINTRVWITELGRRLGRPATLRDIPDSDLDRLAEMGIDWVWLLSIWQTGPVGQRMSRTDRGLRREFQDTLPDLCDDDIAGSGFAITAYTVHQGLGADKSLHSLRERLRDRGLRLMLDFVPNHTGLDHPWVEEHPEHYIRGTDQDLTRAPMSYTRVKRRHGELILAHGRDPHFPGWSDTLQLNYGNVATQEAMTGELLKIAGQCDGVRCDMAMLVLPEVFERTWSIPARPFWPDAIRRVREKAPDFCFLAEVYWDLEQTMLQHGFDYSYDKGLYDCLREGHAPAVRKHLLAHIDFQDKLARFIENHDEPRAAAAFPAGMHEAAAVVTFLAPGLRFFHEGQFEGRLKRISAHLCRAPDEPLNEVTSKFYSRLLEVLQRAAIRQGQWELLECNPAWDGNGSSDKFIAYTWDDSDRDRLLVAVNYADHPSQCYVRLPFGDLGGRKWHLVDLMGDARYERDGNDLQSRGLYLDMPAWGFHVFELKS